jgi:rod shape determining protein RodA
VSAGVGQAGRPVTAAARPGRVRALARRDSLLLRLDATLLVAVLALSVLGAVLVFSASRGRAGVVPAAFLERHLLNFAIGLVLGALTAAMDHRTLRLLAPAVIAVALLGLVAVLSPLGSTVNGSHSWIRLPGGFSLQPAEMAKVGLVVGLALVLGDRRDRARPPGRVELLAALALAAVPIGLVLLQPDLGTTLVLVAIVGGVVFVAGAPKRWLAGLALGGVLAVGAAVGLGVLSDYQVHRFEAFANPSLDPQGVGYNTAQARIAIGSGGLTGTGLFHGPQTQGAFVPEQQTDFVFTVAGEELGLVGSGGLVVLLGVVLWRGCRIAARAGDPFGMLLAAGVTCWFAVQAFENIGMTLGIMPVTGLPLPFVSYGGSATFANLVAVGLLQNVHAARRR